VDVANGTFARRGTVIGVPIESLPGESRARRSTRMVTRGMRKPWFVIWKGFGESPTAGRRVGRRSEIDLADHFSYGRLPEQYFSLEHRVFEENAAKVGRGNINAGSSPERMAS